MVQYSVGTAKELPFLLAPQEEQLDRVFQALSHDIRRSMLKELSERKHGPKSAGQLAKPFNISLRAVLKHLSVLEKARLVRRIKSGRVVYYRLDWHGLRLASRWFNPYKTIWQERLRRNKKSGG